MMVLTHLLLPTITILARQWPNERRVFLPTNEIFEGICSGIVGKFLQKGLWIILTCIWINSVKKYWIFLLSLFMNMSAK